MRNNPIVLGLMSGTSLDGLDMALCSFAQEDNRWEFEILDAKTIPYTTDIQKLLSTAASLPDEELPEADQRYARHLASCCEEFILHSQFKPDLIASHGHTVFHQPEKGLTLQIGDGATIAKQTGIKTISNFRQLDVALGGQGAPLVPVGDQLLFADYDSCLNIGGISNISFEVHGKRVAFDVSPANILLNHFANKLGYPFDKDGSIARTGNIITNLASELNMLPFYSVEGPKSLGREDIERDFMPLLGLQSHLETDILRTLVDHISIQIASICDQHELGTMLVSGGGAKNRFLIDEIQRKTSTKILIPDEQVVDFKEALIFAFLGLLKSNEKTNCYASVTGASRDSSCGEINHP